MLLTVFGSSVFLWAFIQAVSNHPVYEYHDVDFIKKYSDYDFLIRRNDGQTTVLRLCHHEIDPRDIFMAGYHARLLRYQDMGSCDSVLRADLGVFWEVDSQGNVIAAKETSYANRAER